MIHVGKKVLEITKSKPEEIEVFTRNAWTEYCFKKLGAKVTLHPVFLNGLSGTMVRKIVANQKWQNLVPEPVLKYLKK